MEIQDYPNYLIYENGEVWSKKSNKILKPGINRGYSHISLYNNGKQKTAKIHRLVAEHYIPNPDNKPQLDHIDQNKQNNNSSNLRWVTPRENCSNRTTNNEFIGVRKFHNRYNTIIKVDGINKWLGTYDTQELASDAYKKA